MFWKSNSPNLLFCFLPVSVFSRAWLLTRFNEGMWWNGSVGCKIIEPRKEVRAAERLAYKWRKGGGGVDFDAIGMSSQAHEHGPNRTWQYRLVCQSQRITTRCLCWLGVFADKALLSRPCCMHNEGGPGKLEGWLITDSLQTRDELPYIYNTEHPIEPFGKTRLLNRKQFSESGFLFSFIIYYVAHWGT